MLVDEGSDAFVELDVSDAFSDAAGDDEPESPFVDVGADVELGDVEVDLPRLSVL